MKQSVKKESENTQKTAAKHCTPVFAGTFYTGYFLLYVNVTAN